MASRSASRAALLELRSERRVVEDGHRFLDEKRALLAHEVLERLQDFADRLQSSRRREGDAATALAEAIEVDGLENLLLYPPASERDVTLAQRTRSFLGVSTVAHATLQPVGDGEGDGGAAATPDPAPSPEAAACGEAYAGVVEPALELAVELGNLVRLMEEFQRTQRRVRALEKVVLPELRDDERRMEDALEEVDQEDAVRVRLAGGRRGSL